MNQLGHCAINSNIHYKISNVHREILNIHCEILNVHCEISNIQISVVECHISNIHCECLIFNIARNHLIPGAIMAALQLSIGWCVNRVRKYGLSIECEIGVSGYHEDPIANVKSQFEWRINQLEEQKNQERKKNNTGERIAEMTRFKWGDEERNRQGWKIKRSNGEKTDRWQVKTLFVMKWRD